MTPNNQHNDKYDNLWNEMYDKLISYKKQHGDCLVPSCYKEDKQLGKWVHTQRKYYKKNILSIDRIEKLKSIGFVFKIEPRWNDMFIRLKLYKEKYGTCLVPQTYQKDNNLGIWVKYQRQMYSNNRLSNERFIKLKSIGFVFRQVTENGRRIELRKNNHYYLLATNDTVPASSSSSSSSSSSCSGIVTEIPSVRPISRRRINYNEGVHSDQEFDSLIAPAQMKQQKKALKDEVMMDENNYLRKEGDEAKPNKNNTIVSDRVSVLPATPIRIETTTTTTVIRNSNILKDEKKENEDEKMKVANKYFYGESKRASAISSSGIITDNCAHAISNDSDNSSLFDDADEDDSFTTSWCLSSRASNSKNATCDDNDSVFADAEEDIDSSWGCS